MTNREKAQDINLKTQIEEVGKGQKTQRLAKMLKRLEIKKIQE